MKFLKSLTTFIFVMRGDIILSHTTDKEENVFSFFGVETYADNYYVTSTIEVKNIIKGNIFSSHELSRGCDK